MPEYSKFGVHVKVANFYKSLDFYLKLGFKTIFAYGDEEYLKKYANNIPNAPEKYRGMTFEVGNSLFEIADGHVAVKLEVFKEAIRSSKVSAMIDVDSLEKIIKICSENAVPIVKDVKEYPWGTKELVLKDPDGLVLVFREFVK